MEFRKQQESLASLYTYLIAKKTAAKKAAAKKKAATWDLSSDMGLF